MKSLILALGAAAIGIGFWLALPTDQKPIRNVFPDGTVIRRCV